MKKILIVAVTAALVSGSATQSANATFNLTLTAGLSSLAITDNLGADADPAPGSIAFTGALGGFSVSILSSISNSLAASGVSFLDTVVALFGSPAIPGTAVLLTVSDDQFTTPGGSIFLTGVFNSTGAAGISAISTADTAPGLTVVQGAAGTVSSGFATGPPTTLTQTIAGTTTSSLVTSFSLQSSLAVPEPSSMTLLAIGAAGILGYGARRRRKAKRKDLVA